MSTACGVLAGRQLPNRAAQAFVVVVLAGLVLAGLGAATARADYEQVGEHFGVDGEAEQLRNADAAAVNMSGAGGVTPGTLYVVGQNARVLRFGPGAEGQEPPFEEAWGWGVGDGAAEFQRCGPALEDDPLLHTFPTCTPPNANAPFGGEEIGHFELPGAVAVNQATGDVYVVNEFSKEHRERNLIEMFSAAGVPIGEGFGEGTPQFPLPSPSIAESPEKLHEMQFQEAGIQVDNDGTVYVIDREYTTVSNPPGEARVMVFEPETPGNYEHYRYAGQGSDTTSPRSKWFSRIALLDNGRLVTASLGLIREYAAGGGGSALCTYQVPGGQLAAMAADPTNGEVFYFSVTDKKLHRLGPCDAGSGKFAEAQAPITVLPETKELRALAFNPELSWGAARPPGTLYGIDGEEHPNQNGIGSVAAPSPVSAPEVLSVSASDTGTTSATLQAQIDPSGFTTHYRFQYLPGAAYDIQRSQAEAEGRSGAEVEDAAFVGAVEVPPGGGVLGAGAIGSAAAAVRGLDPDTTYRFRVRIESECNGVGGAVCSASGKASSVHTFQSGLAGLSDGRAYELVSPYDKHGGEVFPADPNVGSCRACKPPGTGITVVFPMQSAPEGEAVTYMGFPFSSEEGSAVFNSYVSRRTAAGWRTTPMSPRLQATKESGGTNPLGSLAYDGVLTNGLISQREPALTPSVPPGYGNLYLQTVGAPEVLEPLLTARPPNRSAAGFVISYAGHSEDFGSQFFSANDALTKATAFAPEPSDPGATGQNLYEWRNGQLALINVAPGNGAVLADASFASQSPDTHAVSAEGQRVYFKAGGKLYVREQGKVTREVAHAGSFLSASPDGLRVLLSDGCLYALATETCEDLSEGEGGFQGMVGQSEDLARIYFVDSKVLPATTGTQNDSGQEPTEGAANLYLFEEGARVGFVATLLDADNTASTVSDWVANPVLRTAEASRDGRWLAFASRGPLTGYDNFGPTCARNNEGDLVPEFCSEIFIFNAVTGELRCVSCNPTGEAPRGPSTLRRLASAGEWLPQSRYLSNSGRLFFDSQDRLSQFDGNGRVEDVYEYEPFGVGSCNRVPGCVSLISPGNGSVDSNFLAADESGANVFFTSRGQLVAKDQDQLLDLYDARESGGFSEESETKAGPCQGEACQPSELPPSQPVPGSQELEGSGNHSPRKSACPKGKVKKGKKCLKKRKKRHGKHGHKKKHGKQRHKRQHNTKGKGAGK